MIVSVPDCTCGTLPDTGASIITAPPAWTRRAKSRLALGLTVLMSIQVLPAVRPARIPSGPDATFSRIPSFGRDVKTTSADCATSRGVSHQCSPESMRCCAVSRLRSSPQTAYPAARKRAAIFPPMWPRPTKPIVVVASVMSGAPFDRREVVLVEVEVGGADDRVDLVGAAEADDRAVNRRVDQRPGDGDGADTRLVAVRHRPQALDQLEVLREPRLLEARVALAPVVVGKARDPLARHRAGEHPGAHRRVGDHPDAVAGGGRPGTGLGPPPGQRVQRPPRLHPPGLLDAAELLDAEVRDTDVAREPLLPELSDRRPAFVDLVLGNRPVDLVQVDRVEPEPLEA